MICESCYYRSGCERTTADGRCDFYIKSGGVGIDGEVEVNPMDTMEYDYDDLKKLFEDVPLDDLDIDLGTIGT